MPTSSPDTAALAEEVQRWADSREGWNAYEFEMGNRVASELRRLTALTKTVLRRIEMAEAINQALSSQSSQLSQLLSDLRDFITPDKTALAVPGPETVTFDTEDVREIDQEDIAAAAHAADRWDETESTSA